MNIRLTVNEIVICPICFSDLKINSQCYFCEKCQQKFPIVNKVGVLVPSPKDHLSKIDEKMKGPTKDWYLSSQLKSYDEGPYKFHIQKRIKFLKKILKRNQQLSEISYGYTEDGFKRQYFECKSAYHGNSQPLWSD